MGKDDVNFIDSLAYIGRNGERCFVRADVLRKVCWRFYSRGWAVTVDVLKESDYNEILD